MKPIFNRSAWRAACAKFTNEWVSFSMMRILLISHTCQSQVEGQPRARELARFPDVELKVLIPEKFNHFGSWRQAETPPPDAEYSWNIERVALPWLGPAQNYLHFYPSLPKILRAYQPDIIDLWEEHWSLVSAQACWLRNRILPRTKIIAETEQNLEKKLPPPFENLRSYVLKNADFCIGRSDEAVQVLRAKGFSGQAQAVPNAADADLFRPLDRAACRQLLNAELDTNFDGFLVGYVGRWVEEKGLLDLLEALALCPRDVGVLLAGSGPLEEQMKLRARELKIAERVFFLPHRPPHKLPQVMNALDVLVLPSRTTARWKEQFGRVIIEAHACATPVIGSDSGAIPAVIGDAGLVFSEGDARAFADAIQTLKNDPECARRMGATGRAQVEAKYTWARVAEQMHSIYKRVLET
jgi:glycosyltransferase involved in cell wall biosynthesis